MTHASPASLDSIVEFILDKVAMQTKTPRENLAADTHLATVGVDSLTAVLLCGYMEDEYQLEIEPMMMFEYKTANEVAHAVLDMVNAA